MEDWEVDRFPGYVGRALGLEISPRGPGADMLVPASAAFMTGALFTLPKAGEPRVSDRALQVQAHFVPCPHIPTQ